MEFYIKDGKTWKTKGVVSADKWSICLGDELGGKSAQTYYNDQGGAAPVVGDALVAGEFLGIVMNVQTQNTRTEVTCGTAEQLFDRAVSYQPSGATLEEQIADLIRAEFIEQTDGQYALPYVSVSAQPMTKGVGVMNLYEEPQKIYNAKEAILMAWTQYRVGVFVTVKNDGLQILVRKADGTHHNVVLGDGRNQLISQTYGGAIVEKATVILLDKEDAEVGRYAFYYSLDGTISDEPGAVRPRGTWKTLTAKYDPDGEESAESVAYAEAYKAMADNVQDHTVEIRTDKRYEYGDRISLRMPSGTVLETRITAIYREKADSRTLYRMGTLPVTLSQKLTKERSK